MRRGKILLKRGPAPNYTAFIVICLKAIFLICGFPSLIFNNSPNIFLYFCSSNVSSFSLTFYSKTPKNLYSSGFIGGKSDVPSTFYPFNVDATYGI